MRSSAGSTPRTPTTTSAPRPAGSPALRIPGGPGVRWDSHVQVGYTRPAQLRLAGRQADRPRPDPRRGDGHRCAGPSTSWSIEGIQTTIPLHRRIFRNPDFIDGRVDTTWVERVLMPPRPSRGESLSRTPARLGGALESSAWRAWYVDAMPVAIHANLVAGCPRPGRIECPRAQDRTRMDSPKTLMKVGLLTGGGDCPGLNAVIRAVVQRIASEGGSCVGILEGWRGLVQGMSRPLDIAETDGIIARGGTILGSSRTNPFKFADRDIPRTAGQLPRPRPRRPGRHRRRRYAGRRLPPLQRLPTCRSSASPRRSTTT